MSESTYNNDFPLNDDILYLNHAAVAPWPRRTAEAIQAFAAENLHEGATHYPEWLEIEQMCRQHCADMVNATSTDDIALVKNTSEALSMVAHGLKWQKGENVVTFKEEFPSNRFVWQSLQRYGVETRLVSLQDKPGDPESALLAACDEHTRLVSVSAVQYSNGLKIDLERIGAELKKRDILFCVDAIQHIGALPFDVEAINADFVMADGHKWMLGPEGLALFWSRPESRDALELYEFGWHMTENLYDFDCQDWQVARSARRFECGSPNMLGIVGLNASLSLLIDIGMQEVSSKLLENTAYLCDAIKAHNALELLSHPDPARRSGSVTFRHNRAAAADLFTHLRNNGVVCAERGGGIRFSPHFYTEKRVLDEALEWVTSV